MRSFIIGAASALAFGATGQAAGYGGGGYAMECGAGGQGGAP
jgi:hypothetical protein